MSKCLHDLKSFDIVMCVYFIESLAFLNYYNYHDIFSFIQTEVHTDFFIQYYFSI